MFNSSNFLHNLMWKNNCVSSIYLPQIIPTDHTVKFQKGFENRSSSLLQLRYFDLLRSLPEAGQHFVWLIQRFSGWLNRPFGSELWSYLYWGLKMNWKSWGKMYTVDFVCIYLSYMILEREKKLTFDLTKYKLMKP